MEPQATVLGKEWLIAAVVFLVVLWCAMIYVAIRIYRKWQASKSPLAILRERFAKGEIGKEEFEERRRLLDG